MTWKLRTFKYLETRIFPWRKLQRLENWKKKSAVISLEFPFLPSFSEFFYRTRKPRVNGIKRYSRAPIFPIVYVSTRTKQFKQGKKEISRSILPSQFLSRPKEVYWTLNFVRTSCWTLNQASAEQITADLSLSKYISLENQVTFILLPRGVFIAQCVEFFLLAHYDNFCVHVNIIFTIPNK